MKITHLVLLVLMLVQGLHAQTPAVSVSVFTDTRQLAAAWVLFSGNRSVMADSAWGGDGMTADASWKDRIVIVERVPGQAILAKATTIKNAGGVGMIVINNVDGIFTGSFGQNNLWNFPAVTVSKQDGLHLKQLQETRISISTTRPIDQPSLALKSMRSGDFTFNYWDAEKFIPISSPNVNRATVPNDSAVDFPLGTRLFGMKMGIGNVEILPDLGVTILGPGGPNYCVIDRGGRFELYKTGRNEWCIYGHVESTNTIVRVGESVTYTAGWMVKGSNVSFQWKKDDVELPGETHVALLLQNVQKEQAGKYACVVTNNVGSSVSGPLTLTVE